MLYKRSEEGFTIIELLTVIAILAIISSVLLWCYKGSYQHGRNTITQEYVNNLNKYAELYYLHYTESNLGQTIEWNNAAEALKAMQQSIPNTNIVVLKKTPSTKTISALLLWNQRNFQFELNTTNKK